MDKKKRIFERVDEDFAVRIMVVGGERKIKPGENDIVKSINASASGLLLKTTENIEVGSRLKVRFLKPNSFDFFDSLGVVVRSSENDKGSYEVAVNFANLSEDDIKDLDHYLKLNEE